MESESRSLQKRIYFESEGDSWFHRNIEKLETRKSFPDVDFLIPYISTDQASNLNFLEIGCGSGHRLHYLAQRIGGNGWGIDPSKDAISYAHKNFASSATTYCGLLNFSIGTADNLSFSDEIFDFIYFGFCLYVIDRDLLEIVTTESDRVLKPGGRLAILDFDSTTFHEKTNIHHHALTTYKYPHETLFIDMGYQLVAKMSLKEDGSVGFEEDADKRIALHLLYKP